MNGNTTFDEATQKNVDLLKARIGKHFKCPVCQHDHFGILPGYFQHIIQDKENEFALGGKGVQTIMIVCNYCGYVLEFAIERLRKKPGE